MTIRYTYRVSPAPFTFVDGVQEINVDFGRKNVQDQFQASTARVSGRVLSNIAGLKINDRLTITVSVNNVFLKNVFDGVIADIQRIYGYTTEMDTWVILLEDPLATLGRTEVTTSFSAGDSTGDAASKICTAAGVTYTNLLTRSTVSAQSFTATNALAILNDLTFTEQGRLYATDYQTVTMSGRKNSAVNLSATFSDGTGGVSGQPFREIAFTSPKDNFAGTVIVEPNGLANQIGGSGNPTYTRASYDQTISQAFDLANFVLSTLQIKNPVPAQIGVFLDSQTNNETIELTYPDRLGDRINVRLRSTTYSCILEGWSLTATPGFSSMLIYCSDYSVYDFLILDSSFNGILDQSKLGF